MYYYLPIIIFLGFFSYSVLIHVYLSIFWNEHTAFGFFLYDKNIKQFKKYMTIKSELVFLEILIPIIELLNFNFFIRLLYLYICILRVDNYLICIQAWNFSHHNFLYNTLKKYSVKNILKGMRKIGKENEIYKLYSYCGDATNMQKWYYANFINAKLEVQPNLSTEKCCREYSIALSRYWKLGGQVCRWHFDLHLRLSDQDSILEAERRIKVYREKCIAKKYNALVSFTPLPLELCRMIAEYAYEDKFPENDNDVE